MYLHSVIIFFIFLYDTLKDVFDFELDSDIFDSEDEHLGLFDDVNAVAQSR